MKRYAYALIAVLLLIMAASAAFATTPDGRPGAITDSLHRDKITCADEVAYGPIYGYYFSKAGDANHGWKRLPVGTEIWRNANGEPEAMVGCRNPIAFRRKGVKVIKRESYPVYVPVRVDVPGPVQIVEKPVPYEVEVVSYIIPPLNAVPMSAMPASTPIIDRGVALAVAVGPGNDTNVSGVSESQSTMGENNKFADADAAAAAAAAAAAVAASTAVTPTSGAAAHQGSTSGTSAASGKK